MAGDTVITVIGNLTADPELRWTQSGAAVADFTVASTPRTYDRNAGEWRDGDTLFMRCSVWRDTAENVAESLRKGMRVIVQGRLTQRSYDTQQGERRTVVELQVDEVGPSLRRARAQVTRTAPSGGGGYQSDNRGQQQGGYQQAAPRAAVTAAASRVDTARAAPTTAHRPAAPPKTRGAPPLPAAPPPSATSPRSKVARTGRDAGSATSKTQRLGRDCPPGFTRRPSWRSPNFATSPSRRRPTR